MKKQISIAVMLVILAMIVVPMLPAARDQPAAEPAAITIAPSSYPTPRVPHAAIPIASNVDLAAESSSGTGTAIDPYIIEDLEIDCAGVGVGISITGTTDYAVIRNVFVNASGAGATDAGILMQGVENVLVTNCTLEFNKINIALISTVNCNVTNSTIRHAFIAGHWNTFADDCDDALFSDLVVENGSMVFMRFYTAGTSENDVIQDSTIDDCLGTALDLTYFDDSTVENVAIDNCTLGISLTNSDNTTIQHSSINGTATTAVGIHVHDSTDFNVHGNAIMNVSIPNVGVGLEGTGTGTVDGNTFDSDYVAVEFNGALDVAVTGNYFVDVGSYLNIVGVTGVQTWHSNYYEDYFDLFPNATILNPVTNILEFGYVINATLNDTHPLYNQAWFPRSDEVVFYIYSSIDDMGITYEWFKLYVDGKITPRQYTIPGHVLYRVTVKDFANRVMYDAVHNLNVSDSVEIGLPITTLVLQNDFGGDVLFQLTRNGVTTTFAIAAGDSISIRVLTGTYGYRVTDAHGHTMKDVDGDSIVSTKTLAGPGVVSFGWTSVTPAAPVNTYTTSILDYAIVIVMLGAGFAITLVLVTRVPRKARKQTGVRRH